MNIYLKNIEQNTDQELWLEAEQLMEKDDLFVKIKQLSRTLWNLHVNGSRVYEVEILLKSPKPKFTCECENFKRQNNCKHIVASLVKIKELILEKETKMQAQKKRQLAKAQVNNAYNTKSILEKAHPEELKRFVKNYASKDHSFSLALKGHFANKIDLSDNDTKYKQLLDTAVKPKNFKHKNLSTTERKDFHRLVESLLTQAEDCITLKQFRETKSIIFHTLDKLSYIKKNYTFNEDRINAKEETLLNLLKELLDEKMPPELKTEMHNDVMELLNKSYYVPGDRNLIETIGKKLDFKKESVLELIEKFLPIINSKEANSTNFLVALFSFYPIHKESLKMLIEHVSSDKISTGLQKLYSTKNKPLLILLMNGLEKAGVKSKSISTLSCKTYFELDQIEKGIEHIKTLINDFKDEALGIAMLGFIDDFKMDEHLKTLNKFFSKCSTETVLKFYKATGQIDKLAKELKGTDDLAILWEYDELVAEYDEAMLTELYTSTMKIHLDNYIGSAGREAIQQSFTHLERLGLKKIKQTLSQVLVDEYSHRKILKGIS